MIEKFITLDMLGKADYIKSTLSNKQLYNEYQLFYASLCDEDIFMVGEEKNIDEIFKEKIKSDGEINFLNALELAGFFDE